MSRFPVLLSQALVGGVASTLAAPNYNQQVRLQGAHGKDPKFLGRMAERHQRVRLATTFDLYNFCAETMPVPKKLTAKQAAQQRVMGRREVGMTEKHKERERKRSNPNLS